MRAHGSRRSRRAVSNAVISAALIAVGLALVAFVFVFGKSLMTPPQSAGLEIVGGVAEIPPDGSELTVKISVHNTGNIQLNVTDVTITYEGRNVTVHPYRILSGGSTEDVTVTIRATQLGVPKFYAGKTVRVEVDAVSPQGGEYSASKYLEIRLSS